MQHWAAIKERPVMKKWCIRMRTAKCNIICKRGSTHFDGLMPVSVKPPPDPEEPEMAANGGEDAEEVREQRSGRLNTGEFATWFGNALVLTSIGTIALLVSDPGSNPALAIISDILIATSLALMAWAAYKYFCMGRSHHWSTYIFILFLLATIAAFIWLAIVV
jgi:hypothetical protein